MPAALHPYLSFPGTAREALEFYGSALGATPQFATYGQFDACPPDHAAADKVMHGSLEVTDLIRLYASDCVEGFSPEAHDPGNNVSLAIMGDDEEAMRRYFDNLAEGGDVRMPLEQQMWGDLYGQLVDRFGISWMVNVSRQG